jgi:uncharacterized protein (DUF1697 family)
MSTNYVALLRGINVGGHAQVKMDDLRQVFRSLGHTDVTTYIQSGNVIFTSDAPLPAQSLESAVNAALGMDITIVLRTREDLRRVVASNPFKRADPTRVHVGFMAQEPSPTVIGKLDRQRFDPEEFEVNHRELYLHLPNGMGRAKVPDYLGRRLKVPITIRNWNTVTKLLELTKG